jgi:hypothetical protein
VQPSQKEAWAARLEVLRSTIARHLEQPPAREIEMELLLYNGFA